MPPSKSSRTRNLIAARVKQRSVEEERANKENAETTMQSSKPKGRKKKQRKVSVIKNTRDREVKTTTKELSTLDPSEHDQRSDQVEEVQTPPENLQDQLDAQPIPTVLAPAVPGEPLSQSTNVEAPISVPANQTNTLTELLVPLLLPNSQMMPSAQASTPDPASAIPPESNPMAELASQIRLTAAVCEYLTQRTQATEGEANVADSLALATAGIVAEHPIPPYENAANISARKAYEVKFRLVKLREQEAEARCILEDLLQRFNEAKASMRRASAGNGKTC